MSAREFAVQPVPVGFIIVGDRFIYLDHVVRLVRNEGTHIRDTDAHGSDIYRDARCLTYELVSDPGNYESVTLVTEARLYVVTQPIFVKSYQSYVIREAFV